MQTNISQLNPIKGIEIGTTCAGIKQTEKEDLTLFSIAPNSTCAAVFTNNAFCAAPVIVAKQHLESQNPQFLLINSGNANAGTGEQGLQDALKSCESVAQQGKYTKEAVLPFSTGVIGQTLPIEKIQAAVPMAFKNLNAQAWDKAANAIMTTDLVPKGASQQLQLQGKTVTITGIAKGSGMIKPDMATLLVFLATDAEIPQTLLQTCLKQAVDQSFNRITVDSDTSTNDACVLAATGQSGVAINDTTQVDFAQFQQALTDICIYLAQAVVKDGEGATKFITIQVEQGQTEQECVDVAYTIAHSPLVKTAFFASDANWGRILAAVGRAGIENLEINAIQIYLDEVCIVENGGVAANYTEEQGTQVMSQKEITIRVLLNRGEQQTRVWTCDFSYDYVKINAEYRT